MLSEKSNKSKWWRDGPKIKDVKMREEENSFSYLNILKVNDEWHPILFLNMFIIFVIKFNS